MYGVGGYCLCVQGGCRFHCLVVVRPVAGGYLCIPLLACLGWLVVSTATSIVSGFVSCGPVTLGLVNT